MIFQEKQYKFYFRDHTEQGFLRETKVSNQILDLMKTFSVSNPSHSQIKDLIKRKKLFLYDLFVPFDNLEKTFLLISSIKITKQYFWKNEKGDKELVLDPDSFRKKIPDKNYGEFWVIAPMPVLSISWFSTILNFLKNQKRKDKK